MCSEVSTTECGHKVSTKYVYAYHIFKVGDSACKLTTGPGISKTQRQITLEPVLVVKRHLLIFVWWRGAAVS